MFRSEDRQQSSPEEESVISEDNMNAMDRLNNIPVELHHIFRPPTTASLTTVEI